MTFEIDKKARSQTKAPKLDRDFIPAAIWDRVFREEVRASGKAKGIVIALQRGEDSVSVHATEIFGGGSDAELEANLMHCERLLKSLLWMKGGAKVIVAGDDRMRDELGKIYSAEGRRGFDAITMARIYGAPMEFASCSLADAPKGKEPSRPLGRHLDGCRIGFDLGGSDRKCAAVMDGRTVFSEEVAWDPYFQKDPAWHKAGVNDSLKRAAAKLPRVDAIGGSAAGVYVANRVRIASLFRGVPPEEFESRVRDMFLDLRKEWGGVPFDIVNDGEVTALVGSMDMGVDSVLGISMGTSMAGGYVNPEGNITDWLNELAFAPVDYANEAPADEWSGDIGCGVQYFSQQGVARLAKRAGIELPESMPLAERLVEVQRLVAEGDSRASGIFESIGVCFGYSLARYAEFYDVQNLLVLGRVSSGKGGDIIMNEARSLLDSEFPELSGRLQFRIPDEKGRRHGQAVAAASLPQI